MRSCNQKSTGLSSYSPIQIGMYIGDRSPLADTPKYHMALVIYPHKISEPILVNSPFKTLDQSHSVDQCEFRKGHIPLESRYNPFWLVTLW